jgi:hypothetical protein
MSNPVQRPAQSPRGLDAVSIFKSPIDPDGGLFPSAAFLECFILSDNSLQIVSEEIWLDEVAKAPLIDGS